MDQALQDALIAVASQGNPGDLARLMDASSNNTRSLPMNAQGEYISPEVAAWRAKPVGDRSTYIPGTGGKLSSSLPSQQTSPQGVPSVAPAAPASMSPSSSLVQAMAEYQKLQGDPNANYFDKMAKLNDISGLKAAVTSQATQEALTTASAGYGIPGMYKALEESRLRDTQSPNYKFFKSDSPITLGILNEIKSAEQAAMSVAQKNLLINPQVAELSKHIEPFIKTETERLQREEKIAAQSDALNADYQARYPNSRGIAEAMNRDSRGDATMDWSKAAISIVKTPNGQKAWEAQDNPQDLMKLALSGNPVAEAAVSYKQTQDQVPEGTATHSIPFKLQEEINRKELSTMKKVVESQTAFEAIYKDAMKSSPPKEGFDKFFQNMRAQESTTAGKMAVRQQREDFIIKYQNDKAKEHFLDNPMTWDTPIAQEFRNPETSVGKLYALASAKVPPGQPVSTAAMFGSLKDIKDASVRAAASQELLTLAKKAAEKSSGKYFGSFADSLDIQRTLNDQISQSLLTQITTAVKPMISTLDTPMLNRYTGAIRGLYTDGL